MSGYTTIALSSKHGIVAFCIIYKTSFALMPSFFMITSSFKSPSWHTNDDMIPPNFLVWA